MTADVRHMPPPWFRARRARAPHAGKTRVFCIHHHFDRIETMPRLTGVFLYACRGCGKRLMWADGSREWHGLLGPLEPVDGDAVFELSEDMVIGEGGDGP